jgi:hypothetical protein
MQIQEHNWVEIKEEDRIKETEKLNSSKPKIIRDRIIKEVTWEEIKGITMI